MENGVKPVENRVSDEEEEQKRVLVGSEESKKVDDEVFEEAVGTHDSLHDQGIKTESRNENSVLGCEIDSFEEATGVSSESTDAVVSEDKVKDVAAGDKVDRVLDLHSGEGLEIVKTEVSGEIGKVNGSDIEDERLENGVSSIESLEETINSSHDKEIKNESCNENSVVGGEIDSFEEAVGVSSESADAVVSEDKVKDTAVGDNIDGVSDLHTGDDVEIVKKEVSGEIGKVNESDIEVERLENGDSSIESLEETVEDRKLDNGNASIIVEDKEVRPSEEIGLEEEKSDEIKESKLGGDYRHDKSIESTVASSGATVGLLDEKSKGRDDNDVGGASTELKDVDREVNEISGKFETENKNERNDEVNDAAYGEDILSPKEISEENGTSTNICDDSVEGTVASEMGSSPLDEKSRNDSNENIQTGTGYFNSKSQPQQLNEMVSEVLNINNDNEKNNRVLDEDLEKAKEDPKTQPKPEFASSAPKSTNPVPPARPAGLGRAAPLLEPAPRAAQQSRVNGTVPHNTQTQQIEDSSNGEAEELDETREKLQMIRVKFLRLAHRLGQTPHNVVVAQVLYRLGLAEQLRGRNGGRVGAFSFDRASAMAEQLEAAGQEPLDFSCTIMVLGKSGVGKSATINSIFDEVKFNTDAFQMGTKKVQDVVGTVQGIKVRVIDTPGLLPSWSDQRHNEKILHSVKRFIKKTPPDIVLYLDRLDMQSRDFGDMPLLRTITEIFGPSIWFNAIVVLTHAASAPPDGPNGTASSYDMFVTQRSHVVQQAIRQAAGDMRLMNPVSLVENHSACRTNRAGQRVLPNGQVWKPHLLLLSFASKILAEANALLKLQDSPPGKPFTARSRAPPLPFLLSSLLQSRQQVKLPEEQFGDDDDDGLDDDLDDSSDSEEETELDELPPFKRLTKAQVAKLTKAQKKAYFDELEYREKLFMKKQLKEEKRRRKIMKKMAAAVKDMPSEYTENTEEESGGAASVPVPMPDLALPASFDSDNPTHRYRFLDSSNQWLVRPVLETHGWDHDVGYEGINVERLFAVKDKIPLSFSGQISKDKKDANIQMELNSSIKHGEGKATSVGFDMQTVGKELAYTLRSETRFSNFRRNKATAGVSVTHLGDTYSAGVKVEDKLIVNKRFRVVMTGGAMSGRGDVAYGGSLEAQLRDKDFPLGRSLSTLGLSVMDWHGDLAIGCNIQSQIPVGRTTNLVARANLNNRGAGQVSIRLNSAEQLQLALIGLVPLLKKLLGYSQQIQFGQ